jgi:hypothetical protein
MLFIGFIKTMPSVSPVMLSDRRTNRLSFISAAILSPDGVLFPSPVVGVILSPLLHAQRHQDVVWCCEVLPIVERALYLPNKSSSSLMGGSLLQRFIRMRMAG